MREIVARYHRYTSESIQAPVLRMRTVAWREEAAVVVADSSGTRRIPLEWTLDAHELTSDGQLLFALGDDGKRGVVCETRTGRKLIDVVGTEGRRQSLRAGFGMIEGEWFIFSAIYNKEVSIISIADGTTRGWLGTTGLMWFHVDGVIQLDSNWVCIKGYHDGDTRDRVTAIRASETLQNPMTLYEAINDHTTLYHWGERIAIGPAGIGKAVVLRDPEWDDDEPPDDPSEAFRGLEIWDLESTQVLQRIPYDQYFEKSAVIGADTTRVMIDNGSLITVVSRDSGTLSELKGGALDPYSLELATFEDDEIIITKL